MARTKKRKREHLHHPRPHTPTPPDTPPPVNLELLTTFDKFEQVLCDLLSSASAIPNLHYVLGDQRANFIMALQSLVTNGDLPWIKEVAIEPDATTDTPSPPPEHIHWPPPLPEIPSLPLRLQVFTPDNLQNSRFPLTHYQRLEWLGDAYLEVAVSRILHDRFPSAREGPLTEMRQYLVTNRFLSHIAHSYGFENRIIGISDLPRVVDGMQKSEVYWKRLADCFEAYVAAVAISDGYNLEPLISWLTELYEPEIRKGWRGIGPRVGVRFSAAPMIRRPRVRLRRGRSVRRPERMSRSLSLRASPNLAVDLDSEWEEVPRRTPSRAESWVPVLSPVWEGGVWEEVDGVVVIRD